MKFYPRPSLHNFVKTMLDHGNAKHLVNLDRLVFHNRWIESVEELAAEFDRQEAARSLTACPEAVDE